MSEQGGKPLFDFEVHVNAHNRGKYTSITRQTNALENPITCSREPCEESCVITLSHIKHDVENCVNLLKSTVGLYLFSLHIINVIPSQSFPHSMIRETHAQRIRQLIDVGIDNSQIINSSLRVMHQKRAHWKRAGFPCSCST